MKKGEEIDLICKTYKISRETLRKAQLVDAYFIDAYEKVMSGECHLEELYKLMQDDIKRRKGEPIVELQAMNIKIPPRLHKIIKMFAEDNKQTISEYLTELLTNILIGEKE